MKLSVSLSDDDVRLLDQYVVKRGLASRSAAVQHAVRALHHDDLIDDYESAYAEFAESEDAALWDVTTPDGLHDAKG